MKNMTLQQIAQAVGGILRGETKCADLTREAQGVVIDNRQVSPDDIFVAIRGAKVDGHSFIADAFAKGALGAITDHELDEAPGPYIVVKDTEQALKDLAAYYRGQIDAYVIGIIGSVGKTSTKEMVASVLEEHYTVLKTQGNFNNEIGLPLTLFRIRPEHQVAVVDGYFRFWRDGSLRRNGETGYGHYDKYWTMPFGKSGNKRWHFTGENGSVCAYAADRTRYFKW